VVGVTAAVVADRGLLVGGEAVEVLQDLLDVLVGPLGAFEGGVRLVHVGLMVLVVVDLHRRLVDMGLEGVVAVGKIGNFVSHSVLLGRSVGYLNLYPLPGAPLGDARRCRGQHRH
jgi:hypothetical protein